MPRATREIEIYRRDAQFNHSLLNPSQREELIKPYLPTPRDRPTIRLGIRKFLQTQLHTFIFFLIHTLFSLYIRIRQGYHAVTNQIFAILYYHHRTPELIKKDVKALKRLPRHLSVILKLEDEGRGGIEALVDEIAEIAAWTACCEISKLSIYEASGVLKGHISATQRIISQKISSYYGNQSPIVSVRAPHHSLETSTASITGRQHLSILLISADDGRDSIVDLTKTLTDMSQRSKIEANDISQALVNAELCESVMDEPDLLILFGPSVDLAGYPPWQIRLTEIFHVPDNHTVGYQVFLRALHNYANARMRLGR